jgi:hypothetical protein
VESFKVRDLYPYEQFMREEYGTLRTESIKYFNEMLTLAQGIEPLAYYYYEHKNLTLATKKSFIFLYNEYI